MFFLKTNSTLRQELAVFMACFLHTIPPPPINHSRDNANDKISRNYLSSLPITELFMSHMQVG